ncbi:MAG: LTA synthase family protein, partial [Erysipelotrichaceae bacterium]|nr:LTA synthase family protein [Erysipelotrichaceae bacterium]
MNRRLVKIFLIFSMLPLGIQYFIYRQFRVFYDLKTVLAGGGNALKNFGTTILRMVFSPGGLFHWFLFMIPWILYYIFGNRVDVARRISGRFRLRVIIGMFVFYLLALFFIVTSRTYRPIYGDKYTFHYSIDDFGVLTTLRKEAQHLISGKSTGSFRDLEQEEVTVTPTPVPETEAEVTPRKTENRLDLNFAGSGEVASNKEIEELNNYVQSVSPTGTNAYTGIFEGKNLMFFSAEAFSPWFVTEELTPTLYRLMHKGIYFSDYYQMAGSGTTGGELQNIFGLQPLEGGDSMLKMLSHNNYFTIGSQLNRLGYYGRAFHNNEYRFYDRVETHNNLGYSDTFLGVGNGMEDYIDESLWPESDMEMMQGTLPTYIDKQPFNVYYMTVSGHSVYTQAQNDMSAKHYARVADLDYSEDVKCYIAANLDLEDALAYTVKELEAKGIADDTVIVLTTDHFPYGLGDDYLLEELYGHPITNTIERDQNALVIWSGSLESQDPITVDDPVFSVDILPTLSNLFGTDWDSRLMVGRDVFSRAQPLVFNMEYDWKTDKGT